MGEGLGYDVGWVRVSWMMMTTTGIYVCVLVLFSFHFYILCLWAFFLPLSTLLHFFSFRFIFSFLRVTMIPFLAFLSLHTSPSCSFLSCL
jgi:hypothetical protein